MTWNAQNATLTVETGREGALSAVGHDLVLDVADFEITRDGTTIRARANTKSLAVAGIRKDGRVERPGLSKLERMKVERSIVKEVLVAKKHPEIRFEADAELDGSTEQFTGTLHLMGHSGEVEVSLRREREGWAASFTVHQPDFGIEPYRAFMGALKVHPDVRVTIESQSGLASE